MDCSFLAELFNWASVIIMNHNETVDVELDVEEVEEVIAPGIQMNHNEALDVELDVEEVEEVIAPGVRMNHNETLISSKL